MEPYLQNFLQKFQHLKIQLEEIKIATNNFNDKRIRVGGFGNVYKGEVSHSEGRGMVAIKRLGSTSGQGTPEFLKEITMLSDYKHENVISLLGFCCEGGEMILVYELASRGSLDRYLNTPHLTWSQRIRICLDAAKGLSYLHDPRETHRRLIHCDVKSGNILLDDQWNAKVSDLGLSIMGSANEQHSLIVTAAAGTRGYIDPVYWMTNTLTKESDAYSFGVVLFEVLCGRVCYTLNSNGHVEKILVPTWKEYYEHKKLNDIIFKDPNIQEMDQSALEIFSDIAYRCLKESREDRPNMAEVVTELEIAREFQELFESEESSNWKKQLLYNEEIVKTAQPPLNYRSEVELMKLLYKGVFLNSGKTYFSLNKKGEHCEMISFEECLVEDEPSYYFLPNYNSRFAAGIFLLSLDEILKTHVKTQFLSPGIIYRVNLVFKFCFLETIGRCQQIGLEYKLQGEIENSISHLAYEREDGWWVCELYQFTTDHHGTVDIQILFNGYNPYYKTLRIGVEGIEFWPLEKVEHIDEKQPISDSDSDANWEEKLPTDFEDIIEKSENNLKWTTKEEAYSILRKGFLTSDYQTNQHIWFYLDKNGKKCPMISATLKRHSYRSVVSLPESRFGEAVEESIPMFIRIIVPSELLSSETTYACYLVYKLPQDQSRLFEVPIQVKDEQCETGDKVSYIYLVGPQTPVIGPKTDQNTHNPVHTLKTKALPQQRNDGWIEVQILEFRAATTIDMDLRLKHPKKLNGLIIEGFEFRPI